MDPGSAAFLTLAGVGAVSGYGARLATSETGKDTEIQRLQRRIDELIASLQSKRAELEPEPTTEEPEPDNLRKVLEDVSKEPTPLAIEEPTTLGIEDEPEAQPREVLLKEVDVCREYLAARDVVTLADYRKWMRANKDAPESEKAEMNNCTDIILKNREGGTRKKKLRTRRPIKQNVRRHRSRKNRSNRSDSHSGGGSQEYAGGDEFGF